MHGLQSLVRAPASPPVRRSVGIYVLLLSLPLLVLVPLLAYSGSLLFLLAEQGRETTARELLAATRAMAVVVQRELERNLQTLLLVAASPALTDEGAVDTERMRQLMADVVATDMGIENLALIDRGGRVLLQYPARPQSPPVVPLDEHKRRAFETGQPQLSELRPSAFDGKLAITISHPVRRGGQVPWILSARFDPGYLTTVLAAQIASGDAVATVMDPLHRIVARTREMSRFLGVLPNPEVMGVLAASEGGVRRLKSRDGSEFLWAWATTPAGWSVLRGIPAREVDQALRQSMIQLATVGVVVLLLGVLATVLLARRIAGSVQRMAENAPRLARGEQPAYRSSGIWQLDALFGALVQASDQTVQAIADRDRALSAERAARMMADEDNRTKDVFIATLSHELRNPLAPLRSASHILKAPAASEAARLRATAVIERQVGAMARLLDDLLDLSRIRSGRIELVRKRVTLRSVLNSAVEVAQPLIDSRDHSFSCSLPRDEVVLEADPLRLSQAFTNLLTNAAKYTDPGGRIEVRAEAFPEWVVVRVCDNGVGLAPDELEQVFQMFSQVRGAADRAQGGLGIGLWLVRALLELHGGWVRAESKGPGHGSEFVVGLPRVAQADDRGAPG